VPRKKDYKFSPQQQWIDAIAQPDEFSTNVDMLSRHTQTINKLHDSPSGKPPRELWGTSRYSVPFFMQPVSDMPLNCLENCII
jgi:isopenicillin N synthase-like dioxygenase